MRCIKPNSRQEARQFDAALVLHQLRCCGVLEVARIAQAGYPTRYLHHDFAARYRDLLPDKGAGGWGWVGDGVGDGAAAGRHGACEILSPLM